MDTKFKILVCLLILYSCAFERSNAKKQDVRLSMDVRPEHYKLRILTHLHDANAFDFNGNVLIRVNVYNNTNVIRLHVNGLRINNSTIRVAYCDENNDAGDYVNIVQAGPEYLNDFYRIELAEDLVADNKYYIHIVFNSRLNEGLQGYYRSSYMDTRIKKRRWLGVTHFEPTYARQAFPCFDEPIMKARFEISLGHHRNFSAMSNMPLKSTEPLPFFENWVIDHFEETVPMSTYIVAFSVNDFASQSTTVTLMNDTEIVFTNWVRGDAVSQIEYATWAGPKVLKFFESYFDIKYPLGKMDMIALPDFPAGAMENWGLATFRETAMLFDPKESSSSNQAYVAGVISHELAHQWFGNLVTMEWWSDLWLNEGFATYISSLGVKHLHPTFNSFDDTSLANILTIFEMDSLKSSHPISVEVHHPDEISEIFDVISYKKGSTVIRMMHLFLGEDAFREGVTNYLKKFQYQNAEQEDLWAALTIAGHKYKVIPEETTVGKIMNTWTLLTGYPLLIVERDYEEGTAFLTQRRYLSLNIRTEEDEDACWWIPLSYTTSEELFFNSTVPREWIGCAENGARIPLTMQDLPDENTWLLFNIDISGLYRIDYDNKNWNLLIDFLKGPNYHQIGTMNRAQLVADALDLAWSGEHNDYNIALNVASYLKQEKEYLPWKSALGTMLFVKRMLSRTPEFGKFKDYMQAILSPIFNDLGGLNVDRNEGDSTDIVKFKVLISSWACKMDMHGCLDRAKELFAEYKKYPQINPVPTDLRSTVYCHAIRLGDDSDWEFLWSRYKISNVAAEKSTILHALGCSREIWVLARYLDYSLIEDSGVRKQDCLDVFLAVAANNIGFHLAKFFLEERIEDIYNYLKPGTSQIGRYITALSHHMRTRREYREFTSLLHSKAKFFEDVEQSVKQAKEYIEINIQWEDKNYYSIGRLLAQKLAVL